MINKIYIFTYTAIVLGFPTSMTHSMVLREDRHLTTEELHREWNRYADAYSGGNPATSVQLLSIESCESSQLDLIWRTES